MRRRLQVGFVLIFSFFALDAFGQDASPPLRAAPPPDAKALVEAPKAPGDAPKIERPADGTTIGLSAGGMLTTGNARLLALSGNGAYETRFGDNGIGFSVLGNFGQGAPAGKPVQLTARNVQARLRYDRFIAEPVALFLLNTLRHDRFQGLDLRYNLDPGVKYLFIKDATHSLWVEGGYDLQYDVRRNEDRVRLDGDKNPIVDPLTGQPSLLDKTFVDHSTRLFVGFKHAFNKEVTLTTGLEYLQSVIETTRNRLNYDLLFAAKVGGGLAVGFGFGARYDHAPLPGKQKLDTSTTLSLIYAFSDVPEPVKPPMCPCPEVAPAEPVPALPPAPAAPSDPAAPAPSNAAPAPATAPSTTPTGELNTPPPAPAPVPPAPTPGR